MRKIKGILLFFLTICMLCSIPATAYAGCKPCKETVAKAYKRYRKKNEIKKYKILDIDQNGVNEMFYRKGGHLYLCTYTHKVVWVANTRNLKYRSDPTDFYRDVNRHLFGWVIHRDNADVFYVYKLCGRTKTRIHKFVLFHYPKKKPLYKLDGHGVKKSYFYEVLSQYKNVEMYDW